MSERIIYYDFLRAFAIIAIVVCHIGGLYLTNFGVVNTLENNFAYFLNSFAHFGVPLFIMISGALLLNKDRSFKVFFSKRALRLFPPLIFWLIVGLAVYSLIPLTHFTVGPVLDLALGFNNEILPFWFVWMIFEVYVVIFILNKVIFAFNSKIKNFDKRLIYSLTIIFFIYAIVLFNFNIPGLSEYNITERLGYVFYAFLGYILANIKINYSKIKVYGLTLLFVVLFALDVYVLLYGANSFLSLTTHFNRYYSLLVMTLPAILFVLFRLVIEQNKNKEIFNKGSKLMILTASLSLCSYAIYLNHLIIRNTLCFKLMPYLCSFINPILVMLFLIALLLVISWFNSYILLKIPYLKEIAG